MAQFDMEAEIVTAALHMKGGVFGPNMTGELGFGTRLESVSFGVEGT